MNRGEAASRVGSHVDHAGQGQDERAHPLPPRHLRGLDSAWSVASNPHRESGTRWRAATDVGARLRAAHGRQKGHVGNRVARLRWSIPCRRCVSLPEGEAER